MQTRRGDPDSARWREQKGVGQEGNTGRDAKVRWKRETREINKVKENEIETKRKEGGSQTGSDKRDDDVLFGPKSLQSVSGSSVQFSASLKKIRENFSISARRRGCRRTEEATPRDSRTDRLERIIIILLAKVKRNGGNFVNSCLRPSPLIRLLSVSLGYGNSPPSSFLSGGEAEAV